MINPKVLFPTWSDTNQAVQLQKMARGLKKRDCSIFVAKTKALMLRDYREADLRFCFRICKKPVFS